MEMGAGTRHGDGRVEETFPPTHLQSENDCQHRSQTHGDDCRKTLCKAPKRIRGMILRMLQYDIVVKYTKGKEMHIADTLSRAYHAHGADSCEQISHINAVDHLPIGQSTTNLLRTAIAEVGHTRTLKQTILAGWPYNSAYLNTDIASYFSMRDELAVHDGLIFIDECVIIPQGMRKHIKKRLHLSHMGTDSMVRRAR